MGKSDNDEEKATLQVICGIMLFGVPSLGMNVTSIIPMFGNQPNRPLAHALDAASDILRQLAEDFSNLDTSTLRGCRFISFYETKQSPTAIRDEVHSLWRQMSRSNANQL